MNQNRSRTFLPVATMLALVLVSWAGGQGLAIRMGATGVALFLLLALQAYAIHGPGAFGGFKRRRTPPG